MFTNGWPSPPVDAAGRGAAWGVGLAALTLSAELPQGLLFLPAVWYTVFFSGGAGAFLLGLLLTVPLRRFPRPAPFVGALLGVPLGLLNAALVMSFLRQDLAAGFSLDTLRDLLPAATAGGLGLGYGAGKEPVE